MQGTSAMMIKRGRYLDEIPQRLIDLFDQYEIPLISMPFSVPWMELMSQINTAVMNRTIRRFKVHSNNHLQVSDQSYKVQKINKILRAVEVEMKFPAFIYDLAEEKATTVPRILNESQNPSDYPKAIIGNHQCPIRNIPYAITSIWQGSA